MYYIFNVLYIECINALYNYIKNCKYINTLYKKFMHYAEFKEFKPRHKFVFSVSRFKPALN